MAAKVILNPYAGRGKAGRLQGRVEAALKAAKIDFDLVLTAAPLNALDVATAAVQQGYTPIVAAGGDGLISEVVNGLYRETPQASIGPLGVIPLGTANDLATNLGLPKNVEAAVRVIGAGQTRRLDLGQAGEWIFHNNAAVGLEPVVSIYNAQMTALRGVFRYLVAALRAIADGRSWEMELTWEEGDYRGPVTLVTVGNNPLTGGLFRMAPEADPTDGVLTFVHAYAASRRKMLALLPRTISGTYVEDPGVHQHQSSYLHIRSQRATPLQVDGEVRATGLTAIRFRALPRRLELLAPSPLPRD